MLMHRRWKYIAVLSLLLGACFSSTEKPAADNKPKDPDQKRTTNTEYEMPVIDGIELAKRILKASPSTVVIFLSSYEEFRYAKSALSIGVYDYLLKHEMTKEVLTEKLSQAANFIKDT